MLGEETPVFKLLHVMCFVTLGVTVGVVVLDVMKGRVKELVFQSNGIENIVKSMLNFPDHEDIQENACFCLQHFVDSSCCCMFWVMGR